MADKKISTLTGATTPLAGTEVLPIVQGSATVKVSVANLTAGRAVATAGGSFTDNVTQSTAAKGVNFTANTPAAGMTSQLLNWYEEGTWTPVITGSSTNPTITYDTQSGSYTRIGRLVTCQIYVQFNGSSGGSGDIRISLPFTASSAQQGQGACAIYNLPYPNAYPTASVTSGAAYLTILGTANNGVWTAMQISALKAATATQAFSITVSYIV